MNGFGKQTERKRSAIIEVAGRKLAELSYNRATMKEIAADAKVSQVTIYNYFGSKDELLIEAVRGMMDEQLEQYRRRLSEEADYSKLVGGIMLEEARFVKRIIACVRQSADSGFVHARLREYQDVQLAPFLIELVKKGVREGRIAEDLTEAELLFYFGMYQREMIRMLDGSDREERTGAAGAVSEERFIDFFFHGLLSPRFRV
ncbi:TetR/AcrR family transcriptional regulator [Paenibacillus arenilitoris]|uniref:TetR/AcrR family transcriptional regulator n=1 Tax=Paenibacillus arenilitoris TaxID=2772299 RepID=A0A927H696_9BACL|nr:TetR/AcrR family transcriptional regulator [Paenibacillus arenilitoris]MBD2870316.1 TetR/AcrR family transcriptional regulator [Paenibacillus arenilitoris]